MWEFKGQTNGTRATIVLAETVPSGSQVWITAAWIGKRGDTGPSAAPQSVFIAGGGVNETPPMRIAA